MHERRIFVQSNGALEYNDCTSAEDKTPPMCVLDRTLNNLMVEVPGMLGLWGMRSTPSSPLLPGSIWPGMVAPNKALSMC